MIVSKKIKDSSYLAKLNSNDYLIAILISSSIIGPGIAYGKIYLFHFAAFAYLFYNLSFNRKAFIVGIQKSFLGFGKLNYFFLFSLLHFVVLFFSNGKSTHGLKHLIFIITGFGLSFLIINYVNNWSRLLFIAKVIAFTYLLDIIVGGLEVLQLVRWPISSLSYYNDLFGKEIIINGILSETEFPDYINSMPTSFHWNPNNFATFIILGIPFLIAQNRIIYSLFGIPLIVGLVVAAGAKAAFLGVIAIFIICLFLFRKRIWQLLILFISILFYSTSGFYIFICKSIKMAEIQEMIYRAFGIPFNIDCNWGSNSSSLSYRKELILEGLRMFKENILFGVGGGNAQQKLEILGGIGKKNITNLHNFWLEILVEGGLFYFLLFTAWMGVILWKLWKFQRGVEMIESKKVFIQALLTAFVGLIMAGIGPSSMIYYLPLYVFLGVLIATYIVLSNTNHNLGNTHNG